MKLKKKSWNVGGNHTLLYKEKKSPLFFSRDFIRKCSHAIQVNIDVNAQSLNNHYCGCKTQFNLY